MSDNIKKKCACRKTIFHSQKGAQCFVEIRAPDVKLRAYPCDLCGGWHVTKSVTTRTQNFKHIDEFKKYLNNDQ